MVYAVGALSKFFAEHNKKHAHDSYTDRWVAQYSSISFCRLNYFVTPAILVAFAMVVSGKQYFGEPLQCAFPADVSGG